MKSKTSFSRQASSLKRRSRGSSAITGVGSSPMHPPRGVLPERQVVLPEAELRLHQPGRIGHQPRGHLEEGAADVQRVRRRCRFRLALEEVGDDPLPALRHLRHGAGHQRRVGQPEMRVVGRLFLGHGASYACRRGSLQPGAAVCPVTERMRSRLGRRFRGRRLRPDPAGMDAGAGPHAGCGGMAQAARRWRRLAGARLPARPGLSRSGLRGAGRGQPGLDLRPRSPATPMPAARRRPAWTAAPQPRQRPAAAGAAVAANSAQR